MKKYLFPSISVHYIAAIFKYKREDTEGYILQGMSLKGLFKYILISQINFNELAFL